MQGFKRGREDRADDNPAAAKRARLQPDDDDDIQLLDEEFDWFTVTDANPWTEAANRIGQHHANAKAARWEASRMRPLADLAVDRLNPFRVSDGDRKWLEFDDVINNLGITWTAEQELVIAAVKQSLLRQFYGKSGWEKRRVEIMRTMSMEEKDLLGKPTICNMPRQFGKSTVLRAIMATCLVVLCGMASVVFGPAKRTSHIFTEGTIGMLHRIPGAKERIVCSSAEQLKVAAKSLDAGNGANSEQARSMRNHPSTSTMWSLPSSEKGEPFRCQRWWWWWPPNSRIYIV